MNPVIKSRCRARWTGSKFFIGASLFVCAIFAAAEVEITSERNRSDDATARFQFKKIPAPSNADAATRAKITIINGRADGNGGSVGKLSDGKLPSEDDQPAENFFFAAGTEGGRILIDLGSPIDIKQVASYSWHPGTRAPQVYALYASDGKAGNFNSQPAGGTAPQDCGWQKIADVDTRPKDGDRGGQFGVTLSDSKGSLGSYRYLLFAISRTEDADSFGNTFFSEIDVIDRNAPPPAAAAPSNPEEGKKIIEAEGGKYKITIDTSTTPDLTEWARNELAPVVQDWYPKIVKALPSEGFEAPAELSITFSPDMRGVAATGGTRIRCAESWFKRNLNGEAKGAVVHELVHVAQQYGRARRTNPDAARPPGWLVEGIPDYLRWFKYEPESHGAEVTAQNISRARYDGSYRISGNFLNWVTEKYDKEIVRKLNAALRDGTYSEEVWKQLTGKPLPELGDEWKKTHEERIAKQTSAPAINSLSEVETAAGWKLLFNGKDLAGWHNFKRDDVKPGWQVKEGALVCVDPHNAGDIVTSDAFDWFELQLDYNIAEGGNSGIMFHVTNDGGAAWATGPEFQLEDNARAADLQRCGWLYALYEPPVDSKTGKTLDATKPAGEWNHIRLLISPQKCEHEINGVKYFDYVLGSDDFNNRVAKSKFAKMPLFAKSKTGFIALQGDHGQVSFRSIKVRPIAAEK
jgi:hypothetical protein